MTERKINIKVVLRISYLLLMIASLLASISLIYASAYASAYGGGDFSWIELIWVWKGIVATFIFSAIAFIALKKPNKTGVYFSYSIPIGIGVYFLITFINSTFYDFEKGVELNFEYITGKIIEPILIIGIPWLLILGARKLEVANFQFKKIDYGITFGLTATLFFFWYFMFKY